MAPSLAQNARLCQSSVSSLEGYKQHYETLADVPLRVPHSHPPLHKDALHQQQPHLYVHSCGSGWTPSRQSHQASLSHDPARQQPSGVKNSESRIQLEESRAAIQRLLQDLERLTGKKSLTKETAEAVPEEEDAADEEDEDDLLGLRREQMLRCLSLQTWWRQFCSCIAMDDPAEELPFEINWTPRHKFLSFKPERILGKRRKREHLYHDIAIVEQLEPIAAVLTARQETARAEEGKQRSLLISQYRLLVSTLR
ncbi:hypothetical protein SELMODRAFT_421615 [Selaginella moellendorffii]|uniref:Uncharacterized protein n=1 Tax=Selaginella moellendorffii TaxID=88036 RepID=D8SFT9_SELML|nr:hypothetical protein SELMODRAFT_421615 [Selaginella moellendorffii]